MTYRRGRDVAANATDAEAAGIQAAVLAILQRLERRLDQGPTPVNYQERAEVLAPEYDAIVGPLERRRAS